MQSTRRSLLKKTALAGSVGATTSLTGCALLGNDGQNQTETDDGGSGGSEIPDEPLRIAFSGYYSGFPSTIGMGSRNAAELIVQDINDNGGVLGEREIETYFIDEAGGTDEYTSELRRLVSEEDVEAHIGLHASSAALAAAPIVDDLEIPSISWGAGTAELYQHLSESPWVFRSVAAGISYVTAGVKYVLDNLEDIESVGVVAEDYAWGRNATDMVEGLFDQLAPDVTVESRLHDLGQQDLTSVVTALSEADHDLVFNTSWGGDVTNFVRQADSQGLWDDTEGLFILGYSVTQDLRGDTPEGLIFGVNGMNLIERNRHPAHEEFVTSFYDEYDRYPVYPAFSTRIAIDWYVSAIDQAYQLLDGYPSKEDIATVMETRSFPMETSSVALSVPYHEAKHGSVYGRTTYTDEYDFAVLEDLDYYPAHTINNPEYITPLDWIDQYADINP